MSTARWRYVDGALRDGSPWTNASTHDRIAWLRESRRLHAMAEPSDYRWIAGLDEVGYGALAGPVVAAAVVLPRGFFLPGLDDSKRISPGKREAIFPVIVQNALGIGVAYSTPEAIDRLGILAAAGSAMRDALNRVDPVPDLVLIDGRNALSGIEIPQRTVVRGDSRYRCIAAASIVAKVVRDIRMQHLGACYGEYGFGSNRGYGTRAHRDAIVRHGYCSEHRITFVSSGDEGQVGLFSRGRP